MWIAKQARRKQETASGAMQGEVSIAGRAPAAVTDTEQRALPLVAPVGIAWSPRVGQSVFVLRGAQDCILGAVTEGAADLQPEELRLYSKGASVTLKNSGEIEIVGTVILNGRRLDADDGE